MTAVARLVSAHPADGQLSIQQGEIRFRQAVVVVVVVVAAAAAATAAIIVVVVVVS